MSNTACNTNHNSEYYRVLITGADSYVGSAAQAWLSTMSEHYSVTVLNVMGDAWRTFDFSRYDVVFHVAGLVHRKIRQTKQEYSVYDRVNTKLTEEIAHKAKQSGVQQFIFMSTMSVYSGCKETCITEVTVPKAKEPYGYSKKMAEEVLLQMESETFRVVILRAPMIYGPGCKGNYQKLKALAGHIPVFPKADNIRSMLFIDTLCRFVQLMIDNKEAGVFFPQDKEYVNISELVVRLAKEQNHRICLIPGLRGFLRFVTHLPGGFGATMKKMFGDYTYAQSLSEYNEEYRIDRTDME